VVELAELADLVVVVRAVVLVAYSQVPLWYLAD
jgi:hypothetical protein